jgi:hypothetical protein
MLNQISFKGGVNQCRETGDERPEPNRDGKGKWRKENKATLTIPPLICYLRRRERGDRESDRKWGRWEEKVFTHSGQEFMHSFIQKTFVKHLRCVSHHAGDRKI